MALTGERNTAYKPGELMAFPVAAGVKIYKGGLTVLAEGYAKPGTTATGLVAVGVALDTVDNSYGNNGDKLVVVRPGIYAWKNSSGADAVTQADVGSTCYVVDDETAHYIELIVDLLVNGFERECYDGQYFFDDDHPVAGKSVSNRGAAPLDADAYAAAYAAMQSLTDDRANRWGFSRRTWWCRPSCESRPSRF